VTDAPYRSLCVELPAALFEALRALGDAAVTQAARPDPLGIPARTLAEDQLVAERLMQRYGWRRVASWRQVQRRCTAFAVVLSCGHSASYDLHEVTLRAGEHPLDALDAMVERTPRNCCCVQRPAR